MRHFTEYTQADRENARMLIRFYNMQAGTAYRMGAEDSEDSNQNLMIAALDRVGSMTEMRQTIKAYVDSTPDADRRLKDVMYMAGRDKAVEPQPQPKTTAPTEQAVASSLGILEQAVANIIAKTQAEKIESEIMGSVEQKVRDFIKEEYGTIERKITTVVDGKKVPMQAFSMRNSKQSSSS